MLFRSLRCRARGGDREQLSRLGEAVEESAYVPAYDIASMKVCDLFEAIDRAGEGCFTLPATPELERVNLEIGRMRKCIRSGEEALRITDLL